MHIGLKHYLSFSLLLVSFSLTIKANDLLLEDYSQTDGTSGVTGLFQGPFGTGTVDFETSPPNRPDNTAIRFQNYDVASTVNIWGIVHFKNFLAVQNASSFNQLEFSYYSGGDDSDRSISIQLIFDTGNGLSRWNLKGAYQPLLSTGFEVWTTASINLNEAFFLKDLVEGVDGPFDLANLKGFGILILNKDSTDPTNEPTVYVDDIKMVEVSAIASYLNVSPSSIDFGNLSASGSNFRFSSSIVDLDYLISTGNTIDWEIRAYTSNPDDALGLLLTDINNNNPILENGKPVANIPLKIYRGAGLGDPQNEDEDDQTAWSNNFSFVNNNDGVNPFDSSDYTRVAFPFTQQGIANNPPADVFPVKFAVEVAGVRAGYYNTTVTFELYISD